MADAPDYKGDLKAYLKNKRDKVFNNPRADRNMPLLGNLSQKEIDDLMLYDEDEKKTMQIINSLKRKIALDALERMAKRRRKKREQ